MSLFQPSVLKKHLQQQDTAAVQKAYKKYTKYFHNTTIQANIRNSKEEQFQEGFLRELFVDILGYTLNPTPKFNLTTELKNIKGAKKVDGAILKDGEALGVIELKGTNTRDLESIRQQNLNNKFTKYFSGQYNIEKLTKKLENWHESSFADFIKELNKAMKIVGGTPLTKKDEIDWMDLFEDYKTQAQIIKKEINKVDKEIDRMVYELYGLSEEEIAIVENT